MHHPTDRIAHTTAFVTPVVEHWLEQEIAQWVHPMKDQSDDPSHHERTILPRSYIWLLLELNDSASCGVCSSRLMLLLDGGVMSSQQLVENISPECKPSGLRNSGTINTGHLSVQLKTSQFNSRHLSSTQGICAHRVFVCLSVGVLDIWAKYLILLESVLVKYGGILIRS